MADGKIYITISDTRGGSGTGVSNAVDTQEEQSQKKSSGSYVWHRFLAFAEGQAKQAVNYSVSNIGNFTGDYQAQKDAEFTLKAVNFSINLGAAVIAGAKVGGAPGAAIAAAITVGGEVINNLYRERTEAFNMRRTNRNIALMRQRLGLEGLTDGSRTGGY